MTHSKKRIAIVGGGPAGLSAAFFLTQAPDWQERFEITVYQMGWRLGGKGATGRDESRHSRVEEHGIHTFTRFYFNTWGMMSSVYGHVTDEDRDMLPCKDMDAAFQPSASRLEVELVENQWMVRPGSLQGVNQAGLKAWLWDSKLSDVKLKWIALTSLVLPIAASLGAFPDLPEPNKGDLEKVLEPLSNDARALAVQFKTQDISSISSGDLRDALKKILDLYVKASRAISALKIREVMGLRVSVEASAAMLAGLHAEGFWEHAFDLDVLDDMDCREWLAAHGASAETLSSTTFNALATVLFAYPDGDTTRPQTLSASAWVTWMLRCWLGQGPLLNFFRAGTGETVILPVYLLLRRRGVRFEFFHRLDGVSSETDGDKTRIGKLHFTRQAETISGAPYEPLRRLEFLAREDSKPGYCVWPSHPNWDQLRHGADNQALDVDYEAWREEPAAVGESARTLVLGTAGDDGFDTLVWALPPSMIREVGDEKAQEIWKTTVEHVTTTATMAAQIWLDADVGELGWPLESRFISASMPNPLNSAAAFDDLIDEEDWPSQGRPKGLLYFCTQLPQVPGSNGRDQALLRVRQATADGLRSLGVFLKNARPPIEERTNAQELDFRRLIVAPGAAGAAGEARLYHQYFRANVRPTEAYVQAPPGSKRGRRYAWGSGYDNVVLAGDWTYTGLNVGSFECAVTGGRLAAFAIDRVGHPEDILGFAFLHPTAHAALIDFAAAISSGPETDGAAPNA